MTERKPPKTIEAEINLETMEFINFSPKYLAKAKGLQNLLLYAPDQVDINENNISDRYVGIGGPYYRYTKHEDECVIKRTKVRIDISTRRLVYRLDCRVSKL